MGILAGQGVALTLGRIRMTAADLPDREMGAIEMRGGFFCGERTRAPVGDASVTITRSVKRHNEIVSGTYVDSGDRIFEGSEMVRIFEHVTSASWSQKEAGQ